MNVQESSEASIVPLLNDGDDFVWGQRRSDGGLNQTKCGYRKSWTAITLLVPHLASARPWGTALDELDLELKLRTLASRRTWGSRLEVVFLSEPGLETGLLSCACCQVTLRHTEFIVILGETGRLGCQGPQRGALKTPKFTGSWRAGLWEQGFC